MRLLASCRPYSVLLPVGFTLPSTLPRPRCALTAPFHPYHLRGGLLSVALSLGSPPPDVIRHRVSMEPGLSSPARMQERSPGRLTFGMWRSSPPPVKRDVTITGVLCELSSSEGRSYRDAAEIDFALSQYRAAAADIRVARWPP
jgi:hypothetical protein